MVSAGTLFEKRAVPLKNGRGNMVAGLEMRAGLKESARVTEHAQSGPKAFVFVDRKF
jgi:hypothetical protein